MGFGSGRIASLICAAAALGGCQVDQPRTLGPRPDPAARSIEVVARIPELPTWPCADKCHARRPPDPTPRELTEFHASRTIHHGRHMTWCTSCHRGDDYDRLTLIDGTKVSFDQAFELCGQCHGDKLRDWKNGVHGRTGGSWRDVGQRLSCPACHNPHEPKRPQLRALPAPNKPGWGPGGTTHAL